MSTTNTTTTSSSSSPLLLVLHSDPVYSEVHRILSSNAIGSWAAADELYSRIRSDAIWSELKGMTAKKPTKTATARAADLIEELQRLSYAKETISKAQTAVKGWTAPKTAVKKPAAVTNVFATLVETDDEDEDDDEN